MSAEPDLSWVTNTVTVDAVDKLVVATIEANPGWRLLHVGTGQGGQTTLTYGWPWPSTEDSERTCRLDDSRTTDCPFGVTAGPQP